MCFETHDINNTSRTTVRAHVLVEILKFFNIMSHNNVCRKNIYQYTRSSYNGLI